VPIGTVFWNKKHTPPAGIGDRPVGVGLGVWALSCLSGKPLATSIACSVHQYVRGQENFENVYVVARRDVDAALGGLDT
jgi:hypothetical protein